MIKCPACHSENNNGPLQTYREIGIDYDYTRYACFDCSVEFWTPLIMPAASYYEQGEDYEQFHESGASNIKWWHKSFFEKFSALDVKGKILDIGCADGRFLKKLKDQGWDIYGLDLDKKSVEVAKKNCQTKNIFNCYFTDFVREVEPNSFDVITFFEVLEHQPDPIKFIGEVKQILKPGGWIAGSVPNTERYIINKRFSPDNPPHHFTMWNKYNINNFIEHQGFTSTNVYHTRYEPILIDQIIRAKLLKKMQILKQENSKKQSSTGRRFFNYNMVKVIKKILWNPIYKILGFLEYPILYSTKKSVSLFFQAKMCETRN